MITVGDRADFEKAVRRKLVLEIAGTRTADRARCRKALSPPRLLRDRPTSDPLVRPYASKAPALLVGLLRHAERPNYGRVTQTQ